MDLATLLQMKIEVYDKAIMAISDLFEARSFDGIRDQVDDQVQAILHEAEVAMHGIQTMTESEFA